MSVLAVVAARNEAGYIEVTLRTLIDEGVEVVLLDNGSVDGTRELAERFLGGGLLSIEDLPWQGKHSLGERLRAKATVFEGSRHDWRLLVDADEWLRANDEVTLSELLTRMVDRRHMIVNFGEFVFVPPLGVDMWAEDFRRNATSYYFFAPQRLRLMRAWRREWSGDLVSSAGHAFTHVPPELIHPIDQTLRHYIGLSWSHAISKRANRTFSKEELARGWHHNRRDLRHARPVTASPLLHRADPWDIRTLDTSTPTRFHFWEAGFERAEPAPGMD